MTKKGDYYAIFNILQTTFFTFFVKEEVIVARISGLKSRLVKLCVKLLQSKNILPK